MFSNSNLFKKLVDEGYSKVKPKILTWKNHSLLTELLVDIYSVLVKMQLSQSNA